MGDGVADLRIGGSGPPVLLLQMRLAELGFDPSGMDGQFGPGTARAVRAFQAINGLEVDGVVGDITIAALHFDPNAEIPSGFEGVSINAVAKMFSPHTPLKNIREHLSNVLGGLLDASLRDQKMVLMALASIRAETAGFKPISELPSRFNTAVGGPHFGKYDNRKKLGNHGPPDGERFRGRGFIQLTGRFNYDKFGRALEFDLLANPELANDSKIASRLLAAFLKDKEGPIRNALARDDLAEARKLVNGGSHGLEEFTDAYRKGQRLIASNLELRLTAS
jgi:peptidoglycan L-alanyl-D-glutamate endopeptidase CwlK